MMNLWRGTPSQSSQTRTLGRRRVVLKGRAFRYGYKNFGPKSLVRNSGEVNGKQDFVPNGQA